ncbi:MAG: hypothetical protein GMKNLPBB_02201 [Myxococcota bacterium]|nr:hypothetical protein [Myxococcota bacterium]
MRNRALGYSEGEGGAWGLDMGESSKMRIATAEFFRYVTVS